MESIHGVDVSWMQHSSKDHNGRQRSTSDASLQKESPKSSQNGVGNGHAKEPPPATPKSIPHRPGFTRSNSTSEKTATLNGTGGSLPKPTTTPSPINNTRRNSWLSTISSKFSSSPNHANTTPPANGQVPASPPAQELYLQKQQTPPYMKTAILSPGTKEVGDEPYTPAPPKQTQPNFLQSALRRLSSSSGQLANSGKTPQHGLCQRRTLNVDHHRERCSIAELDQSKLRRVAFCVDVEIASGPKYIDEDEDDSKDADKKQDKKDKKKKVTERGEGEALKHPDDLKSEKENDGVVKATGEKLPKEPEKEGKSATQSTKEVKEGPPSLPNEKQDTKKKEKKKRSEEERKARKEKKRRLAEENGILPVEMMRNISDDSLSGGTPGTPKTQASPTTDPVRIYRRCCQLRETPILKKITEQLAMPSNNSGQPGVVNKLDLTGYWLQLPDLITLGDYLAVVPVKELIMENTGLTDEGVRVILAGLLAAKSPEFPVIRRAKPGQKDGECPQQGGIVERVVLKNNTQIDQVGWRHICLFIHMCRSLKYMDLSQVPLPQPPASSAASTPTSHHHHLPHMKRTISQSSVTSNISSILAKAIGERLGGSELELLNMAECGITTEQLGCLVDGICKSGLRRLGVAGNNITAEGIQHIARYLKSGICEGLDLGGNDLKATLEILVEVIDEDNPLYALSVAACNLTPDSLWKLFPALARLKNFRFIDLSQNHDLFESTPSAIPLLRRYLPRLPLLKRIHLTDVSLMPEQAIALAEILPESPSLAHINIMENKQVAALASAKGEANQEEACALYASLMAAVRVSKSIICIDIEVPSTDSSEVVKALAKQVVAYCLFNMERGPVAEIGEAVTAIPEPHGSEKGVAVPDVLLHLVGHDEGAHPSDDDDEPAPDEDYVIGGTGVVKALGICLGNRGNDSRPSHDRTFSDFSEAGGSAAPKSTRVSGGKAKDMSKNLLGSARKIRARLQPALAKEARTGDRHNYTRLLFLDQTLEGMIKRFEDEFPETRLPATVPTTSPPAFPNVTSKTSEPSEKGSDDGDTTLVDEHRLSEDEDDVIRPMLSRHNSDVSLASKALSQEEGRMHRFGQKLRRDILKPQTESHVQDTNGTGKEADHLQFLRKMVEDMGGDMVKRKVETEGEEEVIKELSNEASLLRQQLKDSDPEGWERFVQSQEAAQRNSSIIGHVMPTTLEDAKAEDSSAIE